MVPPTQHPWAHLRQFDQPVGIQVELPWDAAHVCRMADRDDVKARAKDFELADGTHLMWQRPYSKQETCPRFEAALMSGDVCVYIIHAAAVARCNEVPALAPNIWAMWSQHLPQAQVQIA
eukprot:364100-Chlamydomonas_euryale.AAC.50